MSITVMSYCIFSVVVITINNTNDNDKISHLENIARRRITRKKFWQISKSI